MMWKLHSCSACLLFCLPFLLLAVFAKHHGNTANELVNIMNENRTVHKLPKLFDNPGLGCLALQYISKCMGNCSDDNRLVCQPLADDITEVFAPDCGVELPTVDIISDHVIGCQHEYLEPAEAFSKVLFQSKRTLSTLHQKNYTEVGVGLIREQHGPYFWCVLFSSGQINSTFVLEGGKGIEQKRGCFSGTNNSCSTAAPKFVFFGNFPTVFLTILYFVFKSF